MYILEGNIGVGKSTFLSLLKKHLPSIEIIPEPLDDWNKQTYGQSLLENFYTNTPRWAYTLETLTMICRSRYHIQEQRNKNRNRIMERSIYSGHYCFARNSFESGHMKKMEWDIYNEWVKFLIDQHCRPPLGFIYLSADPEVCFERVQRRNRPSEKNLTLEYIEQINMWHDNFLFKKIGVTPIIKATPVLILNCNQNFEQNREKMLEHASSVQVFINKTQQLQYKDQGYYKTF